MPPAVCPLTGPSWPAAGPPVPCPGTSSAYRLSQSGIQSPVAGLNPQVAPCPREAVCPNSWSHPLDPALPVLWDGDGKVLCVPCPVWYPLAT